MRPLRRRHESAPTVGFSCLPMALGATDAGEVASRTAVETILKGFQQAPAGEAHAPG